MSEQDRRPQWDDLVQVARKRARIDEETSDSETQSSRQNRGNEDNRDLDLQGRQILPAALSYWEIGAKGGQGSGTGRLGPTAQGASEDNDVAKYLKEIDDEFNSRSLVRIVQCMPVLERITAEAVKEANVNVVEMVLLQLSRYWSDNSLCTNEVRFHILRNVQSAGDKLWMLLPKESTDMVVSRIMRLLESNDTVAQSLSFRLLGYAAHLVARTPAIQYRIVDQLYSKDTLIQAAAIFAAQEQCKISKTFSFGLSLKLRSIYGNGASIESETKTQILRVFQYLTNDPQAYPILLEDLKNGLHEWTETDILAALDSLTSLAAYSPINLRKHVNNLMLILRRKDGFIQYKAAMILKLFAAHSAIHFKMDDIVEIIGSLVDGLSHDETLGYARSVRTSTLKQMMITMKELSKSSIVIIPYFTNKGRILASDDVDSNKLDPKVDQRMKSFQKIFEKLSEFNLPEINIHLPRALNLICETIQNYNGFSVIEPYLFDGKTFTGIIRKACKSIPSSTEIEFTGPNIHFKWMIEYLTLFRFSKDNELVYLFRIFDMTARHDPKNGVRYLVRTITSFKGPLPIHGLMNIRKLLIDPIPKIDKTAYYQKVKSPISLELSFDDKLHCLLYLIQNGPVFWDFKLINQILFPRDAIEVDALHMQYSVYENKMWVYYVIGINLIMKRDYNTAIRLLYQVKLATQSSTSTYYISNLISFSSLCSRLEDLPDQDDTKTVKLITKYHDLLLGFKKAEAKLTSRIIDQFSSLPILQESDSRQTARRNSHDIIGKNDANPFVKPQKKARRTSLSNNGDISFDMDAISDIDASSLVSMSTYSESNIDEMLSIVVPTRKEEQKNLQEGQLFTSKYEKVLTYQEIFIKLVERICLILFILDDYLIIKQHNDLCKADKRDRANLDIYARDARDLMSQLESLLLSDHIFTKDPKNLSTRELTDKDETLAYLRDLKLTISNFDNMGRFVNYCILATKKALEENKKAIEENKKAKNMRRHQLWSSIFDKIKKVPYTFFLSH